MIYSNSLYDWNDEETNPQKAHVTIDRCGELNLTVTIKNGDETEPTLVLFAEVDKGVPVVKATCIFTRVQEAIKHASPP